MPLAWDGPYCLFLHACDDSSRPRPWRMPQRRLAHWLLVASLEGDERITVDGRDFAIPRGGGYLIQPGALHTLTSAQGNRPAWVHFDVAFDARRIAHPHAGPYESELGRRASLLQPSAVDTWGVDLPVAVPPELAPMVATSIPRMVHAFRSGRVGVLEATHLLSGVMVALVAWAWRGRDDGAQGAEARIARAEAIAERSLGADFGVDEFAAAAGYSRSRFSAVYTRLRGISPGEHLRRSRMRAAEALLTRPELSVAAVGGMVGYPDATVFGRVFRSHAGATPGTWRRSRGVRDG